MLVSLVALVLLPFLARFLINPRVFHFFKFTSSNQESSDFGDWHLHTEADAFTLSWDSGLGHHT